MKNMSKLCPRRYRAQRTPVGIVPLESLRVETVRDKKNGGGPYYFALRGELGDDGKAGKIKGCKTKKGVVVQGNHTE